MITTRRTILQEIDLSDNESIFSYRSHYDTNKYQGWIPNNLEEVNKFILKNPKEFNLPNTWFQLVIKEREDKTVIGDIGIHFMDEHQCEIGCTLSKEKQGKGYATEGLKGVIAFLFNDLNKHRIITSIDPRNTDSIKLVERLGFRKEGHFKKSLLLRDEWVDDVVYAILKSEWT